MSTTFWYFQTLFDIGWYLPSDIVGYCPKFTHNFNAMQKKTKSTYVDVFKHSILPCGSPVVMATSPTTLRSGRERMERNAKADPNDRLNNKQSQVEGPPKLECRIITAFIDHWLPSSVPFRDRAPAQNAYRINESRSRMRAGNCRKHRIIDTVFDGERIFRAFLTARTENDNFQFIKSI